VILVLQRVSRASVRVDGETVGAIGPGLTALVAVEAGDGEPQAAWCARKVARVRVFPDPEGKMNRSVADVGGAVLAVSQFTLVGDLRKGTRPSFSRAAEPEAAKRLFETFVLRLAEEGVVVRTGLFRTMMEVELVNDGPVTLILRRPPVGQERGKGDGNP
jgi:D-tyrosyl-tRNA(Tyr) deacylase